MIGRKEKRRVVIDLSEVMWDLNCLFTLDGRCAIVSVVYCVQLRSKAVG